MKIFIWYTLSSKSAVIQSNIEQFRADVALTGQIGYEFMQEFIGNDIVWYKTCVVIAPQAERIALVKEVYGIEPYQIRDTSEGIHYIFMFPKAFTKNRYYLAAQYLGDLYKVETRLYTIFDDQCSSIDTLWFILDYTALTSIFHLPLLSDSINQDQEIYINETIQIQSALIALNSTDPFDPDLNIVPGIGKPFAYAVYKLWSVEWAYKFFNEKFEGEFITDGDGISEYLLNGVVARSTAIIEKNGGYYTLGAKDQLVRLTDFLIHVHYQIARPGQEVVYIVSLVNALGRRVDFIEWRSKSSEQLLADSILKYWPFHLTAPKVHLNLIHEMISATRVPTIYTYPRYGLNEYKGMQIMVYGDWVLDIETKRWYPKNEKMWFYFLGGNDGIKIDNSDEDSNQVPRFNTINTKGWDAYHGFLKQLYKGDHSYTPLLIASMMAGISLFNVEIKKPHIYITGTTMSGKSTMSDMIGQMFGVTKALDMGNTTLWAMKAACASMNRLPLFMQEYRTSMKQVLEKETIIRLVFDEGEFSKGRADSTTVHYQFRTQLCMEGEDISSSGSIRSRCLIITHSSLFNSGSGIDGGVANFIKNNIDLLNSFAYSYYTTVSENTYRDAVKEWYKLFQDPKLPQRIIDNTVLMYAGAVAFAPDEQKNIERTCRGMMMRQVDDFNLNGEAIVFLKIIKEYLTGRFAEAYVQDGYAYIDYTEIANFVNRTKRHTSISMDAYRGHMEELGFENDFFEVSIKKEWAAIGDPNAKMIDAARIPIADCPKELLCFPLIYSAYKKVQLTKK